MPTHEEEYVPATDASEAEALRREVRREVVLANALEITTWAGLAVSPAGIFQALRGWYRRRVAPDRHVAEELEARFGREMSAAEGLFGSDQDRSRATSGRRRLSPMTSPRPSATLIPCNEYSPSQRALTKSS
ncbi:MAG: hypothetical protein ACOCYG_07355 [Spirochaetota bacterium]